MVWLYETKISRQCWTILYGTDSFIIQIKTEDFYEDVADVAKKWFSTSQYSESGKRPLPIGMNKKVIGLFKDKLGGKIMIEFVAIRPKTYCY